jgi:hypothetical protein
MLSLMINSVDFVQLLSSLYSSFYTIERVGRLPTLLVSINFWVNWFSPLKLIFLVSQ